MEGCAHAENTKESKYAVSAEEIRPKLSKFMNTEEEMIKEVTVYK